MKKLKEYLKEGKKIISKDVVITRLIKNGNTESDAKKMADKHFDYVIKTYPTSTLTKIAEIIITL